MFMVAQIFTSLENVLLFRESTFLLNFAGAQIVILMIVFTALATVSSAFLAPKEALFKTQSLKLKLMTCLEIVSHREAFVFHIKAVGVYTRAFLAEVKLKTVNKF